MINLIDAFFKKAVDVAITITVLSAVITVALGLSTLVPLTLLTFYIIMGVSFASLFAITLVVYLLLTGLYFGTYLGSHGEDE